MLLYGALANMNIFVAGSRFVMGTQIFDVILIHEKYLETICYSKWGEFETSRCILLEFIIFRF